MLLPTMRPQQHRHRRIRPRTRCSESIAPTWFAPGLCYRRQLDRELGAFAHFTLYVDRALVAFDDAARRGQAQAGAAGLGRVEGAEELGLGLGGHAVAGVDD